MEAEFTEAAEAMKATGVISDYVMLNADNDQSKQISDINDLITMGCDAIIVTAITADGLNDVLEEAIDEGIKVVSFDNLSSSEKLPVFSQRLCLQSCTFLLLSPLQDTLPCTFFFPVLFSNASCFSS